MLAASLSLLMFGTKLVILCPTIDPILKSASKVGAPMIGKNPPPIGILSPNVIGLLFLSYPKRLSIYP